MTTNRLSWAMVVPAIVLAASATLLAGEPGLRVCVASRAYAVTVSPVDEESKQAETSVLYQRDGDDAEWRPLGECRKNVLSDGAVTFTREVEVNEDGLYYYTSRPVVGGAAQRPPNDSSPAQAAVLVDTLPPVAEFVAPPVDAAFGADETVTIGWRCRDENLPAYPAALAYSVDGGKSWLPLAANLPAIGEKPWLPPADVTGPVVLRLTAVDLAGNTGHAARGLEIVVAEPEPAPTKPRDGGETVAKPEDKGGDRGEDKDKEELASPNRSWLYYLMAVNLMRQNNPRDALQYYWLSVKEDPEFIDAWADIGLAYIDLGAYRTARDVVEQTMDKAPGRIDLIHLLGETYHAEGMAKLASAKAAEDRIEAKSLIDQAVDWYGKALDNAAEEWKLADRAASFYRLGEICYYVNLDRDGARAYWEKILSLHSPTPNSDLVLWSAPEKRGKARERYRQYTFKRVALEAWQNWARGYLEQLDARERAGIVDLMPAQKIGSSRQSWLIDADAACGDDGRSLFSLPSHMGSPSPVPTASGQAYPAPRKNRSAGEYSFYAPRDSGKDKKRADRRESAMRDNSGSVFSGGPDAPPPPNPDPYSFPQAQRPRAAWNDTQPYGDSPIMEW